MWQGLRVKGMWYSYPIPKPKLVERHNCGYQVLVSRVPTLRKKRLAVSWRVTLWIFLAQDMMA
jgi:hypothetical protein